MFSYYTFVYGRSTRIKTLVRTEGELWEGVSEIVRAEKIHLVVAHWSTTLIDKDFPVGQKVAFETYTNNNALEEILEEKQKGFRTAFRVHLPTCR